MNLRSRFRGFIDSLSVEIEQLRGTCRKSGEPLTVVCCVGSKTRSYLAAMLFEDDCQVSSLGRAWLWNLASHASRTGQNPGLLFIETGLGNKKLKFYGNDYFRIPIWIAGEASLPLPDSVTRKKDYREQRRKIRKAGFSYEVTRSRRRLENFYHSMYVPQVQGSHGDSTQAASLERLLDGNKEFDLLIIKQGEREVAGEMILYDDPLPKLRAVGVLQRDPQLLKQGALSACYHYAFEFLAQQGFSRVSLGDSRGFINDGVTAYKRKWGLQLVEAKSFILLMKVLRNERGVRQLLKNLPLVCINSGRMESLVFLGRDEIVSEGRADSFIEQHYLPGTEALLACALDGQAVYAPSAMVKLNH